ncbi:transposase [Mycobacterium sp. SM1]|nr:transposase [Mycobacterium sp. SM1]
MSKRLSPAQRLQEEIDGVFAGGEDLAGAIEEVARLGARLLPQAAIEAEVTAFLGRECYQRSVFSEDARAGMRNGYCPTTVRTTAGPVTLERPTVRGTTERFASQLFGTGVTKTNALEALVIAGFVRGLSTRDVEATLVEALGESAAMSKSTVSRICEDIHDQFEAWSRRRLDDIELDYLFLDGSHFKYHANASAEPVLAAWGIDTGGTPVFVGLDAAASESGDAWEGFLRGLGGARPGVSAVGDQRRGTRVDRCGADHHGRGVAAALPSSSRPQPFSQNTQARGCRGQGRLLGDLQPARRHPTRPGGGHTRPEPHRRVRQALARLVSGGGALLAR